MQCGADSKCVRGGGWALVMDLNLITDENEPGAATASLSDFCF